MADAVDAQLIDHHCHGVAGRALDRMQLESFLTESDRPPPPGCSTFDSSLGLAVRRHCGPVLDLPPGAEPEVYVERRAELGPDEANRRLLRAAGLEAMLVDTGLSGDGVLAPAELGRLSGVITHEVVRLESLAEAVAAQGVGAAEFAPAFAGALREVATDAIAFKSIIAYRHGLDFDPLPPSSTEVARAADGWLARGGGRLDDVVLLRYVLWEALGTGMPVQLHTGFGDTDEDLNRCDPALLTAFLRACEGSGSSVLLLHCYPYHRQAAYLANVLPHVYFDLGLTIPYVGPRAAAVLAEALELAPFHKLLYSSDAYGLSELFLTGAAGFRDALAEVLTAFGVHGRERVRIGDMIGAGTARHVYGLSA